MKTLKTKDHFKVGKHNIGWISDTFLDQVDATFEKGLMPSYHTLTRYMTAKEIKSEINPGKCSLGDIIAFLDNAPKECKDGYGNFFYCGSLLVRVHWDCVSHYWDVFGWNPDGVVNAPRRAFSNNLPLRSLDTDTSTLASLATRIEKLEEFEEKIRKFLVI